MKKELITAGAIAILIGLGNPAFADEKPDAGNHKDKVFVPHPADNSAKNVRDRNDPTAKTSGSQGSAKEERLLAATIRRAVVKDKNLSTYAHNVKIIVENGKVTLRGPVRSALEKQAVEAKATEHAGKFQVDNQLEIALK